MSINCELKVEKGLPAEIKSFIERHYSSILEVQGKKYAEARWDEIVKLPSLVFYRIIVDGKTVGWVTINKSNSVIMEFFLDEGSKGKRIEPLFLDKIIEEHKLVAAELPKGDSEKYEFLKSFGFRPTREFMLYGTPMVRMDLSTAIYLEKLKGMKGVAYKGKQIVGIEKVVETQTDDEIKRSLENLIDTLGGLMKFVKRGQTVVLKPNLVSEHGLKDGVKKGGVATDIRVVKAMVELLNPVAVDTVALKIMGLAVEDSPPVLMAYHESLGPIEWDCIEVRRPSIDEVSQPFKRPLINLDNGKCFKIHDGDACSGCEGYLHFVLNKLRRPDPMHEGQLLIDRPFNKNVNVFIGPRSGDSINPDETNIFMGICQQHHADCGGSHLPGCPPHAEEIINGIFQFYRDVEKPKYADKTEEAKLGELLKSILDSQKGR